MEHMRTLYQVAARQDVSVCALIRLYILLLLQGRTRGNFCQAQGAAFHTRLIFNGSGCKQLMLRARWKTFACQHVKPAIAEPARNMPFNPASVNEQGALSYFLFPPQGLEAMLFSVMQAEFCYLAMWTSAPLKGPGLSHIYQSCTKER